MKPETTEILRRLTEYLESNPSIRFGQALFNLDINQFAGNPPEKKNFLLRDIYSDEDKVILKRMR